MVELRISARFFSFLLEQITGFLCTEHSGVRLRCEGDDYEDVHCMYMYTFETNKVIVSDRRLA